MDRRDHTTLREWLDLEADGSLEEWQRAELDEHVAACAECRREREGMAALERLLRGSRLPVGSDFQARVMGELPAAGWEGRHPRTWSLPAAVAVALGVIAALLLGQGSASLGTASSALSAVAGMLGAAVTAGAGLLNASWKGLGLVFQEGLASRTALIAFGVLVLSVNLLLISLVRRKAADDRSRAGARGGAGR
jgi:predicted anti-sigma-YlaC factor YlaD